MKSQKTKLKRKKLGKTKKFAGHSCDLYKESTSMNMGQMITNSTSTLCYMKKVPAVLANYQKNMIDVYKGYAAIMSESGFMGGMMGMKLSDFEEAYDEQGDKAPGGIALYDKTVTKQSYGAMPGVSKEQMAQMQKMMGGMATTTVTKVSEI